MRVFSHVTGETVSAFKDTHEVQEPVDCNGIEKPSLAFTDVLRSERFGH